MSVTVEDAKEWIRKQICNSRWMEAVQLAGANTIYCGQPYTQFTPEWARHVSVVAMGTCEAARMLISMRERNEIPGNSIIVLHNFADQKMVGGYFNKKPSGAQEENLCVNTGLYGILLLHANKHKLLYEDAKRYSKASLNKQFVPMLYHHDVPIAVTAGSTDNFEKVDIITAAAYNIRNECNKPGNYEDLVRVQVGSLMELVNQESNGRPVYFVTGAWGCGVFKNAPEFIYGTMSSYVNMGIDGSARLNMVIAVPSGYNLVAAHEVFK